MFLSHSMVSLFLFDCGFSGLLYLVVFFIAWNFIELKDLYFEMIICSPQNKLA